jgi:hypothetical protein
MPTPEECRHNTEICLKLASDTSEIYVKTALIELAREFRSMAELWSAGRKHIKKAKRTSCHPLI